LNARIDFATRLETNYARNRHPDSERPLVKIDGSRTGDVTVTYDKGGWVFWMLLNHMGRDRALQGLKAFIASFHDKPDHPVLQDLVETLRSFAADPASYDEFTRQWFHEVVLPDYRLHESTKYQEGDHWLVKVRLENTGSGTMPVDVAAVRGSRFSDSGEPSPSYQESRAVAAPGNGESKDILLKCPFEPESLIVDPDAKVLQLERKAATASF
jgi:hypothetical protein